MKKLLTVIFLLVATSAFATDTCTITGGAATHPVFSSNSGFYDYAFSCSADAGSNFQYTLTTAQMALLSGQFAYTIASNGSNTVSDGAELEIRDSYGRVYLDAAGNGNDFLDTSTATWEYFSGPNTDHFPPFSNRYPITIYGENIGAGGGNIFLLITTMDAR